MMLERIISALFGSSESLAESPFCAIPRASAWPHERDEYLKENPMCVCCGGRAETVHHILPVHLYPEKELVRSNYRSVCNKHCCHQMIGHLGDFRSWNPEFDDDAEAMRNRIKNRP
jgi:5-methylcytosine-specific restriction enzyme A